jgi:FMN phosphatase YigB (HAD superfamily)
MALAQAAPESSLFIDDREQNVAPAQRLGMRTALYRDAGELEGVLRDMRLL